MKIVLEKVRQYDGLLVDLVALPADTIFPAATQPLMASAKYKWIQVIDGKPVQGFYDRDLLVLEV